MRILKPTRLCAYAFFFSLLGSTAYAQQGKVTIEQDSKIEQLLEDKRKINPNIIVNDKYKVQIFYGDNDKARKTLGQFKKEFKNLDGTIVYESPTYKVWVGSFNSRIEAEKGLEEIRRKYPNALLIKPNK